MDHSPSSRSPRPAPQQSESQRAAPDVPGASAAQPDPAGAAGATPALGEDARPGAGSPGAPMPRPAVSHLLLDDDSLREVVEEFIDRLDERIRELRQAYEALDWEALTMLAHRLKGAGGSYGYPDLSRLAAEMEQGFRLHRAEAFGTWMQQLTALAAAARAGLEKPGGSGTSGPAH